MPSRPAESAGPASGRASRTAVLAAIMRAAHLLVDGDPKIFSDDLALRLSGVVGEGALRMGLERFVAGLAVEAGAACADATFTYLRTGMALRSRYAEDLLEAALERGIDQYVILGAGLDSFAYRRRDLARFVRIFEVDLPDAQDWKRARLVASGVPPADNVVFVPVDLERQSLRGGLDASGYRGDRPSFVSWLGTTQYLTAAAVFATLAQVASLGTGTEIVLTYHVPEQTLDPGDRGVLHLLRSRAAAGGMPWLSSFDPVVLAERAGELGFTGVADLAPEEAQTRYFGARRDGLCAPRLSRLMSARVGR
jgi:methyltransferase (TIGR00027 family)